MGSLWRSEPMQLVQLFVQIEAAHDTVDELGNLGLIQFRDLNPDVNAFQRNFVNEVKRCDEMERKLRFFDEQVTKEKGLSASLRTISVEGMASSSSPAHQTLDELEGRFDELENELKQMNNNQQMLDRNYNELVEMRHVLSADAVFFSEALLATTTQSEASGLGDGDARSPLLAESLQAAETNARAVKLGFLTGVIVRSKLPSFERVLWRSTRGNMFIRSAEIPESLIDPQSGTELEKNVFIIFFQGERLQAKIKKICESFGATVYPCPETARDRNEFLKQVSDRLRDLELVLFRTRDHRKQVLSNLAVQLASWKGRVVREKAIYHNMNLFNYDVGRKCLIAEGWCPQTATEEIQLGLRRATQRSGALVPSILSVIHSHEVPPTYFETNKYTGAFQGIVNAYGVAHYREVNPTVLTIVTFPFLFGVMFGDVGHGIFLFAAACYFIANEKKLGAQKLNEIVKMPFDGRYVLLLMSFFAIYCGFIYNELFAIPMNLFGTTWSNPPGNQTYMVPDTSRTYPFGIDPAWKGAPNELEFYNSFKMKISILLGVFQMTVGICLSFLNHLQDKPPLKWLNVFTIFLPQMIFLWCIFGYMCILILLKWSTHYTESPPPYILPLIIGMFLNYGSNPTPEMFNGQGALQAVLVVIAILAVPVMLLTKPLMLRRYHNQRVHHQLMDTDSQDDEGSGLASHEEEFEFGEIMIHQIIHTIEFVLGCISNTASYLRLWALSLAHSELSTVFWDRVFIAQVEGGVFYAFIGFAVWAAATLSVLLVMETLSAFLHALRLHWVEFQNKFYHGDGLLFIPFSYKKILAGDDDT